LTAATCVVAEVPGHVASIAAVPSAIVADQIRVNLAAFPAAAAKTGMLYSAEIIDATAGALDGRGLPLVVDPVLVATSGDRLALDGALAAYARLFRLAAVVTPNLDEATAFLGRPIRDLAELREAAAELHARHGVPFLVKGGHLEGDDAVDLLVGAGEPLELRGPFVRGVSTHGTGCTMSAAIAAAIALGQPLREAVTSAKAFVRRAIAGHLRWEPAGRPAVDALDPFA
jgi:hydroxymethylpyrimidine/phosphomethylpyrimidine kinase